MSSDDAYPDRVLAVDLDGTLLKADLSWELLIAYVLPSPWRCARVLRWWLTGGLAGLKARLAAQIEVDGSVLPWNAEVVRWCEGRAREGWRIVLATASPKETATKVTRHLTFITEVLGSDERLNLKAENKAEVLCARYGKGRFDYIGNSTDDLPVWKASGRGWFVGTRVKAKQLGARLGAPLGIVAVCNVRCGDELLRTMRPHQWLKNLLMLVPLLAAHRWNDTECWWRIIPALAAICCAASSAYILNDLADITSDRKHPRKRYRAFASGNLSVPVGAAAAAGLFFLAVLLAGMSSVVAVAGTLGYFVLSVIYSFALKKIPLVDVTWLSFMYSYRVIIGGWIATVSVSPWLLAYSTSLFLGLAFLKRYVELGINPVNLIELLPGRGYTGRDARGMCVAGILAGIGSVVVLGLYLGSPTSRALYVKPEWLWLVVLAISVWLVRIWVMAARKKVDDDPVWFAVRDPFTWCLVVGCVAAMAAAGPL